MDDVIDVQHISYADPEHYAALVPALEGATEVIAAIDLEPAALARQSTATRRRQTDPRREGCRANAIIYLSVMGRFAGLPID